ncbi:hypothetical protein L6272_00290, partial [Microgenomates group bacterium]|nr:hypothetical protein [Microgenomates group bacterium]
MKLLKSIILALGFLFLTFTPILALTCPAAGECAYFSCNQQLIYSQYSGTGTSCPRNLAPGFCSNGYPSNDPCNNNNNGGGGGLSTNIDAQAQGFFAYQSFDKFLPNLLQLALILGAVAAFAFLIWGAIDYIIS